VQTALVVAMLCQAGFGTTYTTEIRGMTNMMLFISSAIAGGNSVQGSYWGFPGANPVVGYGSNGNPNATQSAVTVSIT
jgi:hypothetical protein